MSTLHFSHAVFLPRSTTVWRGSQVSSMAPTQSLQPITEKLEASFLLLSVNRGKHSYPELCIYRSALYSAIALACNSADAYLHCTVYLHLHCIVYPKCLLCIGQ